MLQQLQPKQLSASSIGFNFCKIEKAPLDPIIGLQQRFEADSSSNKVNLGIGAYKDENGNSYIFQSIKKAEEILFNKGYSKDYIPISGDKKYCELTQKFVFGCNDSRIATFQTISGTGALSLAAKFIEKFVKKPRIAISDFTWANHRNIFASAGFEIFSYDYYNKDKHKIAFEQLVNCLNKFDEGTFVLFHACCHNPLGTDMSYEQMKIIADVLAEKSLTPVVDIAYQGFATGNFDEDAKLVRLLFDKKIDFFVCQSYAKNFGLYGERVGTLSIATQNELEAAAVTSQIEIIIRSIYSSAPRHGSELVKLVLSSGELKKILDEDVKKIVARIKCMRNKLVAGLAEKIPSRDFSHILSQKGMFCFTGLNETEVQNLINEHHIYMTKNGRISVTGLNDSNIDYVINSFAKVCSTK